MMKGENKMFNWVKKLRNNYESNIEDINSFDEILTAYENGQLNDQASNVEDLKQSHVRSFHSREQMLMLSILGTVVAGITCPIYIAFAEGMLAAQIFLSLCYIGLAYVALPFIYFTFRTHNYFISMAIKHR